MRIPGILAVSLVLSLVAAVPAAAVEYWVDGLDGNDANTGLSPATAFRTIGRTNPIVTAGDTVHVFDGVYDLDPINPSASGTGNTSRIVYVAEGSVVIQRATSILRSWTTIDGFEAQQAVDGFVVTGTNGILRNCRSLHNTQFGIHYASSTRNVLVERCVIAGNASRGISSNSGFMDAWTIRHCAVVGNGGSGVDAVHGSGNRIENSIVAFNRTLTVNDAYGLYRWPAGVNVSNFNDFFQNRTGNYWDGPASAGDNDLSLDPQFLDMSSDVYQIRATSPLIGGASDGTSIGAHGQGFLSANSSDSWAGWTDGAGLALGVPGAQAFFDSSGNIRVREGLDSAVVLSPVLTANFSGAGFVSLDFDAIEFTSAPAGSRLIVDFDPTTRQREARFRSASSQGALLSQPFDVTIEGRRCACVGRFFQVEYTLRRDGV